jgi:hypothetical protein
LRPLHPRGVGSGTVADGRLKKQNCDAGTQTSARTITNAARAFCLGGVAVFGGL